MRVRGESSFLHFFKDSLLGGGVKDKNIVIKGRAEAVRRAKDMIADRVGGDGFSGHQGYYTTSTFGNGGFSHLSPQPDYSTQVQGSTLDCLDMYP